MNNPLRATLFVKLGLTILLVESLVLTGLGIYYTRRISTEIDRGLETRVQLPGVLMNRQQLRYESVADKEVMTELVGNEFLHGLVVGSDGLIYHDLHQQHVGHPMGETVNLSLQSLKEASDRAVIKRHESKGRTTISCLSPILPYTGAEPVFYVYVEAGTEASEARKSEAAWMFVAGSTACVLLTTLVLVGVTRRMVTRPLSGLADVAERLGRGELDQAVNTARRDEIGDLARGFAAMRDSIRLKMDQLKDSNLILDRERMRLQAIIDALPDLVLVLDEQGRYLEVLASEDDLLYAPASEALGKTLDEVLPHDVAQVFLKIIQRTIRTGESQSLVYKLEVPAGDLWFEGRSSRVLSKPGERGTVVWAARDISERKLLEDNLRQAKEEAEEANLRLMQLDEMKSTFLASVSHELRTPLTSFLGFTKLIAKNFKKHFSELASEGNLKAKAEQIENNLTIMSDEGDRLTRLINDVLDLNRISSGGMSWNDKAIKPFRVAEAAGASVRGLFDQKPGVELLVDVPEDLPEMLVDEDRLLQVFINLLNNAVKFTQQGKVLLKARKMKENQLLFQVYDTGIGLPESELSAVFDRFHQVGDPDTLPASKGAGLGLPICRDIVEHYGGEIWVESEPGNGSVFNFTFPLRNQGA